MTHDIDHEFLMRFVDGELPPARRKRVEAHVEACTECRREITVFRAMKSDLAAIEFGGPLTRQLSIWARVHRRITRPSGWLLVGSGVVFWLVYAAYTYFTSDVAVVEKVATGAVVIGLLLLLASVIWERYREWLRDPYREVER